MKNQSLLEALIADNLSTLIMSMIYGNYSKKMHIGRKEGISQLLYPRHDICYKKLLLDVDSSKMSQPLKRTFLLDAVDEKDTPRLNC